MIDASSPGAPRAEDLVRRLAAGRGVLLVGQRHTAELNELLARDVAASLGLEHLSDLPSQMALVGDPSRLSQLAPVFSQAVPNEPLNALMENPWSMVLSSAIDPAPLTAFVQTGGSARATQVLYPSQFVTLTRAVSSSPTFVPLFGSADEGTAGFRCPTTAAEVARIRGLVVPRILSELPRLVGPGGVLCVVGMGADDWIPFDTLLLSLEQFPDGSIHWFEPPGRSGDSDQVESRLQRRVTVWKTDFKAAIERASGTSSWGDLRTARNNLLRPSDRSVTILDRSGVVRALTISSAEWRGISRFAVLLDDSVMIPTPAATAEEDQRDFRDFLRSPQKVPDWRGIARGYLFERSQAPELLSRVEASVAALSHPERPREALASTLRAGRAPILVEAPPGTGKTRLLQWLAFSLKTRNVAVLYVLSPNGRVAQEPLARACQMLENGGAPAVVVIADGLEIEDYRRLSEFLESVGRRAVVVGTASRAPVAADVPDIDSEVADGSFNVLPLEPRLSDEEVVGFAEYLKSRSLGDLALSDFVVRERYFLLLLYQLLFDTRANIQGAIAREYERLLTDLRSLAEAIDVARPREEWHQKLRDLEEQLRAEESGDPAVVAESPFARNPQLQDAVNLALFCSQIDRPIPLDLLLRVGGDALLADYAAFADTIGRTSLLGEEVVDGEGTVAVLSQHPFMARLALLNVRPDSAEQVQLLRPLVSLIPWDPGAFPGSNPDQDFMVGVLKAIGPNGRAEAQFESPAAREALITLLHQVREVHRADLTSLMLLEANALRLLAKRETASVDERLSLCERALAVLAAAESLVLARKATHARNAELSNILTTMAAVRGYQLNGLVDRALSGGGLDKTELFEVLAEARRCTQVAQGLGPGNFHPTDVAFWAHRDPLVRAPGLSDEDRVSLLARLEDLLDAVGEGDIRSSDASRLKVRQVELANLQGQVEVSEQLAEDMRRGGNYAGVVTLLRSQVFPPDRTPPRPERALAALARLETYGPDVFSHDDAVRLMNRLWLAAFIGTQNWMGVDPVLAACPRQEWIRWRRILESLEMFPGGDADPHLRFCKAWASLQLEEYVRAKGELDALRQISAGNRRRIGVLTVVTDERGEARIFNGQVRRKDADATMVYCPTLQGEVLFPRFYRFETGEPKVGEVINFRAGVNYQGLTPWRLDAGRDRDAR